MFGEVAQCKWMVICGFPLQYYLFRLTGGTVERWLVQRRTSSVTGGLAANNFFIYSSLAWLGSAVG